MRILCIILSILGCVPIFAQNYRIVRTFHCGDDAQGVAVDENNFYFISNQSISKYTLQGDLVATWKEEDSELIHHFDGGIIIDGLLYCSHSNYPEVPMASSIEIFDPESLTHLKTISLGIDVGSCTWVVRGDDCWYVGFAHYDSKIGIVKDELDKDNRWTQIVRYDNQWHRTAGWILPKDLLAELHPYSLSGALYLNGKFYCTGHNEQKLYVLEFPPYGMTMRWTGTKDIPFKGQGIAIDREGNLWGVDRKEGTVMMAQSEMKKTVKVRVGTYNLRRAPLDAKSPDNNWAVREPRLIQSILQCGFDLCGLQEVDEPEQESILRMLSEAGVEYGRYFFSPYAEDGVGNKAHGLIWRKDRFEPVGDPHYFWVSSPPEKIQYNDYLARTKKRFIRGGFCLIIRDLANKGAQYFIMVTHAPLNKEMHAENAHVFVDIEKKYNPTGLPSFFVGDFNARETDKCSLTYRTWWADSYHYFDRNPSLRQGPFATFNGWEPKTAPASNARIDFIYFRGECVKPLNYVCDDRLYDGLCASDHFPVWVDFRIL